MSITLDQVTKRYHALPVVNDVSLDVAEGEFFVLLGPSGSGKSTLLRAIAGLADIDHGSIALHGRDVTQLRARDRGVGFVFQNYALFRHMSVAENIEFALRVRRMKSAERRARRQELLRLVALEGMDNRLPSQLSGGQQQRVAVARALAHKPDVLLLDEPFGALDAKIRDELRRTIREVQRELGITTVLVTHDQEEAFALADRIGVMNLGRLLEVGRPQELYARPATRFVATFLGAANLLLALQGPDAIRFGSTTVDAAARNPVPPGREHEVVTVMRPEEVELAANRDSLVSNYIGRAVVEEVLFTGALERLRLRILDEADSVQLVGSGNADARIEATRSQPEQRALPLQVSDTVSLGARRLHVLPTPLSSFVACAVDDERALILAEHPVLAALATRMKTRVARYATGAGVCEQAPTAGVAAIVGGAGAAAAAANLLERGTNEVLVLPASTSLPKQVCIFWMADGVRHATLAVAASLSRQLAGEAICIAVAPEGRRESRRPMALRTLLDARSEAKAAHGLEVRTELLTGVLPEVVSAHLASLSAPILALGVTHIRDVTGVLATLVEGPIPVLLVYRSVSES
jgi:sulfate/thiosulfate transport system ATP-binding protein